MMFWLLITPVIVLIVLILFTFVSHFFLRVPYVPTPRKVVREMINIADMKGNETVMDLGAGDARVLRMIKKVYPGVTAIGYELAPTVWLLGKFQIWLSGQKVTWYMRSMFKADLKDTNCIFLYLFPGLMQQLGEKFDKELAPGTKVISYAFFFPDHKPIKQKTVPWLTGNRQLYLYEW